MQTTNAHTDAIALTKELIEKQSVTPADDGCQPLMAERLSNIGFTCESLPAEEVLNLWATRGDEGPLLVFAGHTDVVPPGPQNTGIATRSPRPSATASCLVEVRQI